MLASAVNSALQPVQFPNSKTRLLLVSDSHDRLKSLEAGLNNNGFDITTACSLEELATACNNCHDLIALDVSPEQIAPMLKQIRTNASSGSTPATRRGDTSCNAVEVRPLTNDFTGKPCRW